MQDEAELQQQQETFEIVFQLPKTEMEKIFLFNCIIYYTWSIRTAYTAHALQDEMR